MSIQRIVQDGRLLITVSGGAPPSRYIPYPPFPGTATEKTKKPAQTHCLSGTNTDKQYPWYHPHSGRPALSSADRHCPTSTQRVIPTAAHTRRFGNGNAPRRLLLTEDCLRVRPPSEVHSPTVRRPDHTTRDSLCAYLHRLLLSVIGLKLFTCWLHYSTRGPLVKWANQKSCTFFDLPNG